MQVDHEIQRGEAVPMQDESAPKDDKDEDPLSQQPGPSSQTATQHDTSQHGEDVAHPREHNARKPEQEDGNGNSDDDNSNDGGDVSDEDKPLDLAEMNRFEYQRVQEVAKSDPTAILRYEQYRRSDLKNNKVKRVLQAFNPAYAKVSEQYIIAVKGLAKLFVGDVTEAALQVKEERGDEGPLQPMHLREAFRRLRKSGVFPTSSDQTVSFM